MIFIFYRDISYLFSIELFYLEIILQININIERSSNVFFSCCRRASSATTYNPNNFSSNVQRTVQPTTQRGITYVSGSARPFTSTTRLPNSSSSGSDSSTTARPKSGKKNDYDYAYYDNTGGLEYDGVDLEHVTSNKESTKIARN